MGQLRDGGCQRRISNPDYTIHLKPESALPDPILIYPRRYKQRPP